MEIFPIIQPELFERENTEIDNVCTDVKWENGEPVLERGNPVFVSGADAAKSWAARCLLTEKGEHEAQGAAYGAALRELIGQGAGGSELAEEVKRALLQNEFILSVDEVTAEENDGNAEIHCRITTTEEEAEISV